MFPPYCAIVRAHAVKALGELNAKERIYDILKVLNDVHYLPRSYSIETLREILLTNIDLNISDKEKIVSSFIEKAENDSYFGVRAAANNALKETCNLGTSSVFIKAKAVLGDTQKREEEKEKDKYKKTRVIQEAYQSLNQN